MNNDTTNLLKKSKNSPKRIEEVFHKNNSQSSSEVNPLLQNHYQSGTQHEFYLPNLKSIVRNISIKNNLEPLPESTISNRNSNYPVRMRIKSNDKFKNMLIEKENILQPKSREFYNLWRIRAFSATRIVHRFENQEVKRRKIVHKEISPNSNALVRPLSLPISHRIIELSQKKRQDILLKYNNKSYINSKDNEKSKKAEQKEVTKLAPLSHYNVDKSLSNQDKNLENRIKTIDLIKMYQKSKKLTKKMLIFFNESHKQSRESGINIINFKFP